MFPNLQDQSLSARVRRAIARIEICTTTDDLDRVWTNCQPLYQELKDTPGDEALTLLRKLCVAKVDVQFDIGP